MHVARSHTHAVWMWLRDRAVLLFRSKIYVNSLCSGHWLRVPRDELYIGSRLQRILRRPLRRLPWGTVHSWGHLWDWTCSVCPEKLHQGRYCYCHGWIPSITKTIILLIAVMHVLYSLQSIYSSSLLRVTLYDSYFDSFTFNLNLRGSCVPHIV